MIYQGKEFTPIKNFDGYFICKETTEVLSIKDRINTPKNTAKILKQVNNSKSPSCNYYIVTLVTKEGKHINKFIHRLMAETFIPNPDNKNQVNHIDGNKLNNKIENLEWVTEQENAIHAIVTGLDKKEARIKEVHQYAKDGTYIASYKSRTKAFLATGIQHANINKVVRGERKYAGGYIWSSVKKDNILS